MTNYMIYNCNSFFAVSLKYSHMKSDDVTHNYCAGKAKTMGQTKNYDRAGVPLIHSWEGGRDQHY